MSTAITINRIPNSSQNTKIRQVSQKLSNYEMPQDIALSIYFKNPLKHFLILGLDLHLPTLKIFQKKFSKLLLLIITFAIVCTCQHKAATHKCSTKCEEIIQGKPTCNL